MTSLAKQLYFGLFHLRDRCATELIEALARQSAYWCQATPRSNKKIAHEQNRDAGRNGDLLHSLGREYWSTYSELRQFAAIGDNL